MRNMLQGNSRGKAAVAFCSPPPPPRAPFFVPLCFGCHGRLLQMRQLVGQYGVGITEKDLISHAQYPKVFKVITTVHVKQSG